jgi:hypothetical protein
MNSTGTSSRAQEQVAANIMQVFAATFVACSSLLLLVESYGFYEHWKKIDVRKAASRVRIWQLCISIFTLIEFSVFVDEFFMDWRGREHACDYEQTCHPTICKTMYVLSLFGCLLTNIL